MNPLDPVLVTLSPAHPIAQPKCRTTCVDDACLRRHPPMGVATPSHSDASNRATCATYLNKMIQNKSLYATKVHMDCINKGNQRNTSKGLRN